MIAIASTDLLFALDSIPATFGVTQEPFLDSLHVNGIEVAFGTFFQIKPDITGAAGGKITGISEVSYPGGFDQHGYKL